MKNEHRDIYAEKALKLLRKKRSLIKKIIRGSEESNKKVNEKTELILKNLKGKEMQGKPLSLLAGSLYIVLILEGCRRTQREICSEFEISEFTLRKAYREIAKTVDEQLISVIL
ncbi:MAG: hypothetical protein NTU58_02175 [Candidatus Nealsonbacteria bacterium]|nr:hypothetical protein [Candidatus Nealsonbacteria bacterium]